MASNTMPHFRYFSNASIEVTRPSGNRTPEGYEQTGSDTILSCRADFQESGRSLERAQQQFETGDGLVFCEKDVVHVESGDNITITADDGRQLEGSVEEIMPIDGSLLISL